MQRRIAVLMAIDEAYAGPLCVTVTSLLDRLCPDVGLALYVMASGVGNETRRRIAGAFDARVALEWVSLDAARLRSLHGYGHVASPAASFRLLAGSSLPPALAKVIYLDADLLVQDDLAALWERPFAGHVLLAVQDAYVQRGLDPRMPAPYFNSGLMVIDLAAWRAADVEAACLGAARRLQHTTRWLDQDALNAGVAGRWGALPPRWNKQYWLDVLPDWRCSPYSAEEFEEARCRPAIVHFCSETKPWHPFNDHAPADVAAYRRVLARTPFHDARALRPTRARREFERFAAAHRRVRDATAAMVRASDRTRAVRAMLPAIARDAVVHTWTLASVPLGVARDRFVLRLGAMRAGR